MKTYDVIVIGGGHAGCEAAAAAARVGASTLLLTQSLDSIGQMSCNPAIGGIGKSHLVREIDAMGGVMAQATDIAGIQFRILNASKGPAVRATRAQADRSLYRQAVRALLDAQPNLELFQQAVTELVIKDGLIAGVVTEMGLAFSARAVVLTTGTFLGGRIHVGEQNYPGGRAGDAPANALSDRLRSMGLRVGRLKTGTPPRIDARTANLKVMAEQPGDLPLPQMSFLSGPEKRPKQVPCFITTTNEKTHAIIRASINRSAMFSGAIEGVGPRYCPSIEDKVYRFSQRDSHQVFVEPEGLESNELYPNGISTSLPYDVQIQLVRSISGFENAHITRPGYAIEYDYLDPRDLSYSLETRATKGLFFAGQINGTTGYEEAAAQGLLAGINAAILAGGSGEPWVPRRDEAYIGVLVDDLINLGTNEPYRMFTSRAEYRLRLREDNADARLTPIADRLGLIGLDRKLAYEQKRRKVEVLKNALIGIVVAGGSSIAVSLETAVGEKISKDTRLADFIKRPGVSLQEISHTIVSVLGPEARDIMRDTAVVSQVEIETKYEGYIKRQDEEIAKVKRHESIGLTAIKNYNKLEGLSNELKQKLTEARPKTLAHASRIPGMTAAALSLLLVHAKKARETIKTADAGG